MKEGWVWFRANYHNQPRAGYLLTEKDGKQIVTVPHRFRPNVAVFRYDVKDLIQLEPLPPKVEFELRLKGKLGDFRKNEDYKIA